jgi:profilin
MSWQAYVDNHLMGSQKLMHAAILDLDGSSWAKSPDFSVSELKDQVTF